MRSATTVGSAEKFGGEFRVADARATRQAVHTQHLSTLASTSVPVVVVAFAARRGGGRGGRVAAGVAHAALFGSRARGEDRADSDVGLQEYIAGLFDGPVDVVNREGLKQFVRPAATAEAIYAF